MGNVNRREFLTLIAGGAVAVAMLSGVAERGLARREKAPERPNILFLLTDNQGWDMMGCTGNPIIHTPNMDKLADSGVRFTNAFVTTPICAASRASILFGRPKIPKSEGVRTERWKYIRYFEQRPIYEELYDLENDPHEARNLAGNPRYVKELDQLRKRCDKLLQRAK